MSMYERASLPKTWEVAELGEIIEVYYGKSLPEKLRTLGRVPVMGSSGVVGTHSEALVDQPCLVVGRKGCVGAVFHVEGPCWPIDTTYVVKAPTGIQLRYLSFVLTALELSRLDRSTAIPGLSRNDLYSVSIPLAPQNEQYRIVEKVEELLSDLDAGVVELKTAQKKLAQYRQSLLKAAVEGTLTAEWRAKNNPQESGAQLLERILKERRARWEEKQLTKYKEQGKTPPNGWREKYPEPVRPNIQSLPELPNGWSWASIEEIASDAAYSLAIGPFGSNLKVSDYKEDGVPLVFVRNIRLQSYGGERTRYINPEKATELSAHSVEAGDVLITKMGEPPGDADVYPLGHPRAVITADCIKVTCSDKLMLPRFLATVVNSHIGKRQIEPMTQGVAQKKVSLGRFSRLAVPVPSVLEQETLVELLSLLLEEVKTQEKAILHSLQQSSAQRKNILKAAFSGQLVPQDPKDEPASVLLERIRAERAAREAMKKPGKVKAAPRRKKSC